MQPRICLQWAAAHQPRPQFDPNRPLRGFNPLPPPTIPPHQLIEALVENIQTSQFQGILIQVLELGLFVMMIMMPFKDNLLLTWALETWWGGKSSIILAWHDREMTISYDMMMGSLVV